MTTVSESGPVDEDTVDEDTGVRFCAWCGQPDRAGSGSEPGSASESASDGSVSESDGSATVSGSGAADDGHAKCRARLAMVDPPRFCTRCARRMVVQVTPAGWQATCSRHGQLTSN